MSIRRRIEQLEENFGSAHDTAAKRKIRQYLATKSEDELRAVLRQGPEVGEGPIADALRAMLPQQLQALQIGRRKGDYDRPLSGE